MKNKKGNCNFLSHYSEVFSWSCEFTELSEIKFNLASYKVKLQIVRLCLAIDRSQEHDWQANLTT